MFTQRHVFSWYRLLHSWPVAQVRVNGSLITGGTVQVLNGTESRLQCLASGSSPLVASWSTSVESANRDLVRGDGMTLRLTHEDEGIYICTANNTQEKLSHSYSLEVKVYGDYISYTSRIYKCACSQIFTSLAFTYLGKNTTACSCVKAHCMCCSCSYTMLLHWYLVL